MAGDHRLRLREPGLRQVEVKPKAIGRAEGEVTANLLERALDRVKGRVRQAVR